MILTSPCFPLFLRAAKANTKPQRIIPSGGVITAAPGVISAPPTLLNPIDVTMPLKVPTIIPYNNGGVAKKTTKNHPRIKYSIKHPPLAGQPTTTAHSMASLVSSISTAPIAVSNPNQKSELLNFTMARKFGNKLSLGSSFYETDPHKIGTVISTPNTATPKTGTLVMPPTQIFIQQPIETKVANITNEELQTSIISELSSYEIDEIELNPYPDAADSIDRDSQSGTMYRMSAGGEDSKCSDSNEMKYNIQGGDDDANKNFECRHCGKKYRWKSTLRRHENVECGGKEPSWQCPHCSYKAKQRGNLGVHIRKHHGELPQLDTRRKNRSL